MSMARVLIGDMFKSNAEALVNSVNCVGVMGKGVALEFKKRFPHMFDQYVRECNSGAIKSGVLTTYNDLFSSKMVINFPTKKHWKSPTLLSDIEAGLDYFRNHYKEWQIKSVAFPPLGCGSGGLSWSDVGPLMYSKLYDLDIVVEIYAPFGTPKEELNEEFLLDRGGKTSRRRGRPIRGTLREGEVAVLEVLKRIQQEQYTKQIGRVMFQKACYVLTEAGVPTEMVFSKNSFGPFSSDARHALIIFANNNLIKEEKAGGMFKVIVTDEYDKVRKEYEHFINQNEAGIARAVDLLGRIKNTDQGEEVATVMYATKSITLQRKSSPTPNEILAYIFEWKKKWGVSISKKSSLIETIGDLAMLGWIKVRDTESLLTVA